MTCPRCDGPVVSEALVSKCTRCDWSHNKEPELLKAASQSKPKRYEPHENLYKNDDPLYS